MSVQAAIEETAARAKDLLFNAKGKRKGEEAYIGAFVFQTVLRIATIDETFRARHTLFDWKDSTLLYDAGIAHLLIADARAGDAFWDRVICCAASVMLEATCSISDPQLRAYVCERLSGVISPISKRGRGRSKADNSYRDVVVAGRLIPPLLDRFNATRNPATKHTESACSIVEKALSSIRIHISEDRIEGIWGKVSRYVLIK